MSWLQLSVEAGEIDAESLSAFFESRGALSVTFQDAADQPLYEPDPGTTPLWSATRVIALFDADADGRALAAQVGAEFGAAVAQRLHIETLADRDWERAWLDGFRPMRFGRHLWICPAGMRPRQAERPVIVDLDPGLAFGTGTHATTRLCLEWLDAHPPAGLTVLDYGCGSGVLGIAALKLGAREVTAVDIDPQALLATHDNARRNGVDVRLSTALPGALRARLQADVLLANILANPLVMLAETLTGLVKPEGRIVLSGILAGQHATVAAAYRPGFELDAPVELDGWLSVGGRRRARGQPVLSRKTKS